MAADFEVGDACTLGFPDESFDTCRCERVLMHLAEPHRAVSEMIRVLRPGGTLAAIEPDWDTLVVDTVDHIEVAGAVRAQRLSEGANSTIGRQLRRIFLDHHLDGVTVLPVPGLVTDHAAALEGLSPVGSRTTPPSPGGLGHARRDEWLEELAHAGYVGPVSCQHQLLRGRRPQAQ